MTTGKKAETNKKKREQYRRNICINEYAASKCITIIEVNSLINSKELLYNKELLPNNVSHTINVEMTTERYDEYRIWAQLGCPIPRHETQQDRSSQMIPSNNKANMSVINESHTTEAIITHNDKNECCHDESTQDNAKNLNNSPILTRA